MTISNTSTLAEIREVNLSYLLLAQRLLQEDRVSAMYRLGLSEQVAKWHPEHTRQLGQHVDTGRLAPT